MDQSEMTVDQEILIGLTSILRHILKDHSFTLTRETKREDISDWDSINYINFIESVEQQYAMKFRLSDIESFANVGEIVDAIKR